MERLVSPWSFCYFLLFISTKLKHFEFSKQLNTSIGCTVEYFPFWVPVSTQEPSKAILSSWSPSTLLWKFRKSMMSLGVSWMHDQGCRSLQIQPLSLTLSQQLQTHEQLRALRWQLRISLPFQEVWQLNQAHKIKPRAGLKIIKNKIKINYIN